MTLNEFIAWLEGLFAGTQELYNVDNRIEMICQKIEEVKVLQEDIKNESK